MIDKRPCLIDSDFNFCRIFFKMERLSMSAIDSMISLNFGQIVVFTVSIYMPLSVEKSVFDLIITFDLNTGLIEGFTLELSNFECCKSPCFTFFGRKWL